MIWMLFMTVIVVAVTLVYLITWAAGKAEEDHDETNDLEQWKDQ